MNGFARHKRMFSCRVDLYGLTKGPEDEMGGPSEDIPTLLYADRQAYIEDLNAMDVAQLNQGGLSVNTFVFVPENPGILLEGSQVRVRRRGGVDYPDTIEEPAPVLRVMRVGESSIGSTAVWRIECKTRS